MEEKETKRRHRRSRRAKKQNQKQNLLSNLILVVAILVFVFSAFKLVGIWLEYRNINKNYAELQENVLTEDSAIVVDEETGEEEEKNVFRVDFNELLALNSDVVGWIRFDEPEIISYPIAIGETNKEYLRTNLEGKKSTAGTIFVDYRNNGDFKDLNTLIYGHNMRNGSMFGQLKKYLEEDFYEANPYFYIYTPDGMEMTYQIFSIRIVKDTSDAFDFQYENSEEFMSYIDKARRASYVESDAVVSSDSRVVTLSTCSKADDERLLIHAVKVRQVLIKE